MVRRPGLANIIGRAMQGSGTRSIHIPNWYFQCKSRSVPPKIESHPDGCIKLKASWAGGRVGESVKDAGLHTVENTGICLASLV